jgi:hypothetical protein
MRSIFGREVYGDCIASDSFIFSGAEHTALDLVRLDRDLHEIRSRIAPRQSDIDQVSDEEIQDILLLANLTPRKRLGHKTLFQAILKETGKDGQISFS